MKTKVEVKLRLDRVGANWRAQAVDVAGALAVEHADRETALRRAQAWALRCLADLVHEGTIGRFDEVVFNLVEVRGRGRANAAWAAREGGEK